MLRVDRRDGQGAQPAAGSDAAALHKQRLEQQHSHKQDEAETQHQQQQQGDMSLPGRIESTTAPLPPPNLLRELPKVVDLPPLRKSDPAKAAADAEFDYGKELQRGAALGSGGAHGKACVGRHSVPSTTHQLEFSLQGRTTCL